MREMSTVFRPRPSTTGTVRQQIPALRQLIPWEDSLDRSFTVFFININYVHQCRLIKSLNYPKSQHLAEYLLIQLRAQPFQNVLKAACCQQKIIQSLMQVHRPLNSQYTCSSCLQNFDTADNYKQHYKSDFHRYNIKRKMVKLPPVTLQQFSTKLQQTQNNSIPQLTCNQCRKTFASLKTFNQHVESKGHNPNAIIQTKQKIIQAPIPFSKNALKCFFCLKIHQSLAENLQHMESLHSFFIAQQHYCKNVEGLIEYLQEKIEVGHMCITCENKGVRDFQSGDAVRKHMADKGHNFMKVQEGFEEYQKFYDFSALFEEKLKQQQNVVPGIEFQKVKVFVDESAQIQKKEEGQEDEWQDQQSGQQNQGDWQQIQQQQDQNEQETKQVKKRKTKTYLIMKPTLTANDELLLPNGKLLGHRKYRHIYKQTIRMPFTFGSQLKMLTNGEHSTALATIETRRQLLEVVKAEKLALQDRKREKKHALLVGMTNNGLMHHFRCQNSL